MGHRYFEAVFLVWVAALNSDIRSVIRVNGHLFKSFKIMHSVLREFSLSSFLYALNLEPLLQKLATLRGISRELECGRSVSAYADDATVIVPNHGHIEIVDETLKEYDAVVRVKINSEKSLNLWLGTSGSSYRPTTSPS